MLTRGDITVNLLIILIFSGFSYVAGLNFIRKNDEDTEYTENIRLNKTAKLILLLSFYREDKIEMEAVIHNTLLIILTIVISTISFYKIIGNTTLATCYFSEINIVWIGCMIYRFKTRSFKNSKDHYE